MASEYSVGYPQAILRYVTETRRHCLRFLEMLLTAWRTTMYHFKKLSCGLLRPPNCASFLFTTPKFSSVTGLWALISVSIDWFGDSQGSLFNQKQRHDSIGALALWTWNVVHCHSDSFWLRSALFLCSLCLCFGSFFLWSLRFLRYARINKRRDKGQGKL